MLEAYGWQDLPRSVGVSPTSGENPCGRDAHTPCEELLTRLVALNHERAAEEKRGHIRWLRPDYQNPRAAAPQAVQATLTGTETTDHSKSNIQNPTSLLPWPDRLPEQVALLRKLISTDPNAAAETLSAHFGRKNKKRTEQIEGILETLKGLGQL